MSTAAVPRRTTSDTGVDITNLEVGERLRLYNGVTKAEDDCVVVRMDSERMGIAESGDGNRAMFHAFNVTARGGNE